MDLLKSLNRRIVKVLLIIGTWFGIGAALHDYMHQVWQLKGTVFSLEGGYIGFAILIPCVMVLTFLVMKERKRR